ncbi:MAG: hypothetical protein IKM94_01380 [Alphaproteobacteria bacterium]|nr:hypothetical protein [Alphaproteobacteria bacterium]
MKKIILALAFGLITNSAYSTYYQTTTNDCSDANMMARLDGAVATHRAVITEITCDYTKPVAKPKPVAKAKPVVKHAPKKIVRHEHRAPKPQPIVVKYEPVTVVQITTTETCTCFDCGC